MSENKDSNIITIDECLNKIPNGSRFALAVIAAERASEIENGSPSLRKMDDHKSTVTALQEISSGILNPIAAEEKLIQKLQKTVIAPSSTENASENENDMSDMEIEQLDEYLEHSSDMSLSEEEMTILEEADLDFKS